MKTILKPGIIFTFCFLSVLFNTSVSMGQTFNFRAIERDSLHTGAYIRSHSLNDTIVVSHDAWDDMVSNSTTWGNNLKFKSVHDFVRFSVDYAFPVNNSIKIMDPYTLRLTFKVYGFANPSTPNTATVSFPPDTLTISYKPDSLAAFQDKQYKKYTGCHKIMIVLTGLYEIDNASGTPTPITLGPSSSFSWVNFNVEGAVIAQPYDKKVKYSSTYKEAYGTDGKLEIKPLTASNDNLPVYWQMYGTTLNAANVLPLNPVNYELEWTYVDNYSVDPSDGTSSAISTSSLTYNFEDNATRVVLDTNYYKIPLIYQNGYIVYRVRMVRPDSVNFQYPIYGPWTITDNTGTISSLSGDYIYHVAAHINDSLNWQYTVSFAEQGKYKHVMSYYDGMLKNRQSITRFNSMPNKLIATEQIYDFEGRPSISILPTPITTDSFRYQPNLALNSITDTPFRARDFDTVQLTSCPNDIRLPPLSSSSLANIYYSPDNPDQGSYQRFVPDAGGYPLVQTVYSPGYDERVEKQGGAGDTLQIGYQHNVKNDYTGTEQTDLNRLFGTNIGWTGYYRKTVSRDPNGQLSLNITDYKGKTMMSSMIGLPDTMIHAMVSNENLSDTVQYKEDFLAGMPQQTAGNQRILDKLFFNEAPGNNTSQYVYHFAPYQTFCSGKYLTVKAAYDYTIFDECGIAVAHSDSVLGETGVLSSATADTFYETPPTGFYMEKGKHSLNKVLTINTDDVALAVDSFMSLPTSENCLKDEPWFIKESVLSKEFPCPEKYIDLNCPSCGSKKYEMIKELYPNFDSTYVERKYGVYEIINGVVVGNNNSDFTLFCGEGFDQSQWTTGVLAADLAAAGTEMSPYINVNNWPVAPVDTDGISLPYGPYITQTSGDTLYCKYRYQDTCAVTMPDTVIKYGNIYTNLQHIPVQDFINIFNDSIAEALLPMHPEYCKMLDCVDDDVFPRLLNKIPNAKIAEPLSLLYLADLIQADPIFTVMSAHPGDFPNPFDFLGYITDGPQGPLCLDTIALNVAYCRSTDVNMLSQCQSEIFQSDIASGTLINDYVKERYFQSLRQIYLANRKRYLYVLSPSYSGSLDCSICESVRMKLVPEPVFPNNDSIGVSMLDNFVSDMTNGSPQTPSVSFSSSALTQYFELVDSIDISPFQPVADSALNTYDSFSNLIIQATLDSMMAQFVNCIQQDRLPQVRDYLQGLYDAGLVTNFTFTPAQVLEALNSQSITLDDLCNPYIVNYDGLANQADDGQNGGINCGSQSMFDDITNFLNGSTLTALQNIGTSYPLSLSSSSQFEEALATHLGSYSCDVVASLDAAGSVYMLTYSYGSQSVKLSFVYAEPAMYWFTPMSGETITLQAVCAKEAFGGFPLGYIGNYSFAILKKHESAGITNVFRLKAWNDKVEINDLRDNPISQCVPYTQFRSLFSHFQDTMVTYDIKSLDHPYFSTMLKNFMNYSLHKVFTEGQYMDFLESSALSDSTLLYRQIGYVYLNAYNYAYMTQFMTDINAVDSLVNIMPSYRLRYPGYNSEEVAIDFRAIPKNRLRLFSNFVSDYVSSHPTYFNSWEINMSPSTWRVGALFVPANSGFNPDSIPFPSYGFTFSLYGGANNWNGIGYDSVRVYNIYANGSAHAYDNSYNTWYLEKYLNDHGFAYQYYPTLYATVNDEYRTDEKQAYLHYTYGFQYLPSSDVLDTLQTANLNSLIPLFGGKLLSYGHPARPDNLQHLYIGDTATATDGTKYDKLTYIITKVKNYFNNLYSNTDNNILFAGANTRTISVPSGEMLTAYRCKDTAFWYRYFDQGDTLYDVFLRIPAYVDTAHYASYQLQEYGFNLGEGNSRSFYMKFYSPTAPIHDLIINGFTDFTVAKNKVLHDVLLNHTVNESEADIDTVLNCEHSLLNTAIYEGKVKYKFYIDSIRNRLYGDFFAYIMNGGITEKLLVSYRNQRFNYTLYNYDRAGNLALTVPPAGVSPLTLLQVPTVDPARQGNSDYIPDHKKVSIYKYNSLNQVYYQKTPDGGVTNFFYDAAGRVIFSQNDKQKPDGYMTYTLYDKQGRIVETGQAKIACNYFTPWQNATPTTVGPSCSYYDPINHLITPYPDIVTDLLHKTHDQVTAYIHSLNREEVVLTTYDKAALALNSNPGFTAQENLRKRVADIRYFASWAATDTAAEYYDYAMHFSYDIAGNVKTLVRDYPGYKSINEQFKRVDYDYDVISGKVNMLSYNRGFPDQYYQKYAYDADNRITKVETSSDGIIWQRDASYEYYQHGPLARMEIGDLLIQGVDYAYTIQGWLKSINSDLLTPEKEMGGDGVDNTPNELYARDVAALSLDYFNGDYKPIGTDTVTHLGGPGKNLYNGNIPRATTSIIPFPDLKSQYTYDQLNRIVRADYAYMNRASAALTNTADYYSSYAYDPDGNLKKLVRNGNKSGNEQMDSLTYYYQNGVYSNNSISDNKLVNIADWANDGSGSTDYPIDITHYTTTNSTRYQYDATGNVIQDLVSGQDSIKWNHYNKVVTDYNNDQNHVLDFAYDGAGNRYLKSVTISNGTDSSQTESDYYVRDAQGNILAIYKDEGSYVMTQQEWIEYFTQEFTQFPCDRLTYLTKYIFPFYGAHPSFTNEMFAFAQANNLSWVQAQVNDSAVSFYMNSSYNVLNNTVAAISANTASYPAMAQWAVDNSTAGILTPALYERTGFASNNISLMEPFLSHVFGSTNYTLDTVPNGVIGLLCNYAPDIMDTVMSDYGLTPTASSCEHKGEALAHQANNTGHGGVDFFNEIYVLRHQNPSQYHAFLSMLFDAGSIRFYDNTTHSHLPFIELLCNYSDDGMQAIMDNFGLTFFGDCLPNVTTLESWLQSDFYNNAELLNDFIMTKKNFGHYRDAFDKVYETSATANNEAILPMVYKHFVTSMSPAFVDTLFADLSVSYHAGDPDYSAQQLFDAFKGEPSRLVGYLTHYMHLDTTSIAFDSTGSVPVYTIYNFLDSLIKDSIIMDNPYFTTYNHYGAYGNFSYLLHDLLLEVAEGKGPLGIAAKSRADLMSFIDGWGQGRTMMERGSNINALLNAVYNAAPAQFLNAYCDAAGNNDILTQSLMAIHGLSLTRFVDNIRRVKDPCRVTTVTDSIIHVVYVNAGQNRRFSLASHVLYGSSRLGTKDYLPGQFYKYYNAADSVTDTASLGGWRPWYNLEVNDWIAGLVLEPYPFYSALDYTDYYASHVIGRKQYELTNHLGNVQATVTDLPYYQTGGLDYGYVTGKSAAMASAYDYYPFGMLMPDRYVSDTSSQCMTLTESRWVTTWVDSCYDVPLFDGVHLSNLLLQYFNGATLAADSNLLAFDAQRVDASISLEGLSVVPNAAQSITFDVDEVKSGSARIEVAEVVGGQRIILGSALADGRSLVDIHFVPSGSNVTIDVIGPFERMAVRTICIKKPLPVEQTYLVDICSGLKDRYRFGFNGQEKVNEWAGIGNHNTAEFWEYDTRTGRRYETDPKSVPTLSPYSTFANSPLLMVDPMGDKEYENYAAYKKDLGDKAIAQDEWHGQDGNWLRNDREQTGNGHKESNTFTNANEFNINRNDGSNEYQNLGQRKSFYTWFQNATEARGFKTKWPGGAAQAVNKLEWLVLETTYGNINGSDGHVNWSEKFGYSNKEIQDWVRSGNKLILDDVWPNLMSLYNGPVLTGRDAYNWDAKQLLREQQVINPSYWRLSNASLTILENSLKKKYFLSKFMPGPKLSAQGSVMSVTDRWVYGMTLMGYKVTPANVPIPAICPQSPSRKTR